MIQLLQISICSVCAVIVRVLQVGELLTTPHARCVGYKLQVTQVGQALDLECMVGGNVDLDDVKCRREVKPSRNMDTTDSNNNLSYSCACGLPAQ